MSSHKDGYAGTYRLLNLLATGQSTEIWEAMLDSARKRVAIKRLQNVKRNRQQRGLLRHEYAVGKALVHPRVIKIDELGVTRKETFLVMELYAVPNMKQMIYAGVEEVAHLAAGIIDQAAEALTYLAGQGWVHRDVKPDNFLISPEGELKLIDFALATRPKSGLAKMLSLKAKPQGTMSYMSPEQILGKPVDFKTDVYGLGCTVFELVSGRKPFTGMTTNELLQKHLAGQVPALEAANRNVTADFGSLIKRALAKKPEERPSMADFRREAQSIALFKMRPKPPGEVPHRASLDEDEPAAAAPPVKKVEVVDSGTEFDLGEMLAAMEETAPVAPSVREKFGSGTVFDLDEMFAAADSLRREETDDPNSAAAKPAVPPRQAPTFAVNDDSAFDVTPSAPAKGTPAQKQPTKKVPEKKVPEKKMPEKKMQVKKDDDSLEFDM